jgi:hypothetical protein
MDDDSKQAWMKVGLHFAAVGDKLRGHAKQVGEEVKGGSDDAPDQAAVVDALNTLGQAMNQAVSSLGNAAKDPDVRDGLTEALNSMGEAMNVTFGDVGDKVGEKVKDVFGRKPTAGGSGSGSGAS